MRVKAEGESAGCGGMELRCCDPYDLNCPLYTCPQSVKFTIPPFLLAESIALISLVLKVSAADVSISPISDARRPRSGALRQSHLGVASPSLACQTR